MRVRYTLIFLVYRDNLCYNSEMMNENSKNHYLKLSGIGESV